MTSHDCFSVSHYIYPAHELPHQNLGVYIKLDRESLAHPMRQANLNIIEDSPSPGSF